MNRRALIAAGITALAPIACADGQPLPPPEVGLAVPPAFSTSVSVKRYRAGEDTLKSPPYRLITAAPMTEYHGWFGPRAAEQSDIHGWTVQVYATLSKKVAAACAAAKNGAQTILTEGPGLLDGKTPSDMTARFRRRNFSWGRAVSFLSQSTQEGVLFAPVNGHLQYEVWGISADQKYTVVASVSVSHPKLADWNARSPRVARSMKALKQDRDYKRIETCRPEEFKPSLTAFDQMLDSLTIRQKESSGRVSPRICAEGGRSRASSTKAAITPERLVNENLAQLRCN